MLKRNLHPAVLAARKRLAEGREKLRRQHDADMHGVQLCAHLTDLLDSVLLDLCNAAKAEVDPDDRLSPIMALVPNGGYGRRDVAPFSDVDLMLLHAPGASEQVTPFAKLITQFVFDSGLILGLSARTPRQCCQMALGDSTIFTSLAESRFLGGSVSLFTKFMTKFRRTARQNWRKLAAAVKQARDEERRQNGETVYLLEPNVKKSLGALRDIQYIRWLGFAKYGESDFDSLQRLGVLSPNDRRTLRASRDFLLNLRNEMHFHANKEADVLTKGEQARIAELWKYQAYAGVLPVEAFMRDYFEHTGKVRDLAAGFFASVQSPGPLKLAIGSLLSHKVEDDFLVGPYRIRAKPCGLKKLRGDLDQVLRLMDLASGYDKRIDAQTWEAVRESMGEIYMSPEAARRFLSLIAQPTQLGELLRKLHQLGALEKFIPPMAHARSLVQWNEYHKYTIDEHSLRTVEAVTDFWKAEGPQGDAYRRVKNKRILHLAALMHDLGKGYEGDHSIVGAALADETSLHLQLSEQEARTLHLLIEKHLLMSHIAQRRNIEDPAVILQLALAVESPDVLRMLYLLTCADLTAVGPGVFNQWKSRLITQLYRSTMQQIAGEAPQSEQRLKKARLKVRNLIPKQADTGWWERQIEKLPSGYAFGQKAETIVKELEQLASLGQQDVAAWAQHDTERNATQFVVGAYEQIAPGVFHRLTGALTGKGLQILSAEINTLAGGLFLDRFFVNDPDFAKNPSQERLDEICQALVDALKNPTDKPTFRRKWQTASETFTVLPTRVKIDNETSDEATIIDVFTHDRIGLLYTITRTLFELGLSVQVAKIGTYLDQVVDVFYVTEQNGGKLKEEQRIEQVRETLLAAIDEK